MSKLVEALAMTLAQKRGRARLMVRLPHWRVVFDQARDPAFLDLFEAYELTCNGLAFWITSDAPKRAERIAEYEVLATSLELEAASLATARTKFAKHGR
ncbi:hypothetical protein [Bosea sp. 2RAB26]|uniref:hypothetical protein n=1 Tax=Bosea sp. 2RAB26 TaxID=3237476 RepID=UPI003F8FA434